MNAILVARVSVEQSYSEYIHVVLEEYLNLLLLSMAISRLLIFFVGILSCLEE